jgi:hypothetical protein
MSKEELAMQGSTTDRTSTGYVAIHPLDPEDAALHRETGWLGNRARLSFLSKFDS